MFEKYADCKFRNNTNIGSTLSSQVPSSELFLNTLPDEHLSSSVLDNSAFSYNVKGYITDQILNTIKPSFSEYFEFQKPKSTKKKVILSFICFK